MTEGVSVTVYGAKRPGALPVVWLCAGSAAEGEQVFRLIKSPCRLACVTGFDWQRDLSPWPAPALRRGEAPFLGGADDFLQQLTGTLLPRAEKALPAPPPRRALAGYSMAGLFALYALYRTDVFSAAAAASPSLWYDGFAGWARGRPMAAAPGAISLSLGTKEGLTRSARMAAVTPCTQALADHWRQTLPGARVVFAPEPGGHFTEPAPRMARAIDRLFEA